MYGSIIDFEDEFSRHGQIFAREDVLAELCRWLVGDKRLHRGWLLLLGGPGVGKSAILTSLLRMLPAPRPPCHFIRRGMEGFDRPEVVVQSLCAQLERLYPEHGSADLPSEMRLGELLKRLSTKELARRGQRLLLVIDGLDEAAGDDPLPRILPRVLPPGVVILCASRPIYPALSWLERDGVQRINLNDEMWAASNENACLHFWQHHADEFAPPLSPAFIHEAVRRCEGNMLYAVKLRDWLRMQPPERRVASAIPYGLDAFLTQIWTELNELDGAVYALVMEGLGLACAAREALPAYLFREILEWPTTMEVETFLRAVRPFLLETRAHWHKGESAYQPFHAYFREFISGKLGSSVIREHHLRLTETLAAWPPNERDPFQRAYALRHAVAHRIEAGELRDAQRLCTNLDYLKTKFREIDVAAAQPEREQSGREAGATSAERDLDATVRASVGGEAIDLAAVLTAVCAEASRLGADPESLPVLIYNRLRCAGWSVDRIKGRLGFGGSLPALRLLHGVRLGPARLRSFRGHEKQVTACVITPDETHLLSASADGTLRLWALGSAACIAELRGHEGELTACAITRDGNTAISTSTDGTARTWDIRARRCVGTLENGGRCATACAVTHDGLRVVIGSDNGLLQVWDLASRERVATMKGHADYITACVIAGDGELLVSASRDGSVRVWRLASGECVQTLRRAEPAAALAQGSLKEQGWIAALALTPDGKQVVAAAGDGCLAFWDLLSGGCVRSFGAGQGRVDACSMLHDGRHVLCGMADGTMVIWDIAAERRIRCLEAHAGAVSACAPTADGRRILSASYDRTLALWEIGVPESLMPQDEHDAPVAACAAALDAPTVISGSEDRTLKIWDAATGACRATLAGHADLVTACASCAKGRRALSGARDGSVRLWNLTTRRLVEALDGHAALVSGCAFTPDGRMITASHDGTLRVRGADDKRRLMVLRHGDPVEGFSISQNGDYVLSFSRFGTAKVWALKSGRCERTFAPFTSPILAGALTPDGRRAVLALESGEIEVWDIHGNWRLPVLKGHRGRVFGCAVLPDGARVVSASEDKTLKVWNLHTGVCLGTLYGTSIFRCVAVTKTLICAGDHEGNVWMIAADAEPLDEDVRGGPAWPSKTVKRAPRPAGRSSPPLRFGARRVDPVARMDPLAAMADVLAGLYTQVEEARLIAEEAGIDIKRVNMNGSALVVWHSILKEASKRGLLRELVRRPLKQYPGHSALSHAAQMLGVLR
ncbi:WD-repeat protein [Sorangium cellulosum So ce56]|uniref:WD-repeat protein n=1 Tax=Sorangium cellulosum (strain So ce56) TaxID=448385 RepID=A9ERF1_SORC5|nr:NACHT domain-containing protein [Sorangium cellulosum]CAN97289.1 WD-repeat protein [Sorangium cellulosum So ce56]